jgi:hypothetical protein
MTNEEFADLLMVLLHDEVEAAPHSYFYCPLNELATRVDGQYREKLLNAAQILEDKSLIILSLGAFGQASAFITPKGFDYVENGGDTGIIGRFRNDPDSFLVTTSPLSMTSDVPGTTGGSSAPVPAESQGTSPENARLIVNHMMNILMTESTMDPVAQQDAITDLEALNAQLGKKSPNPVLIDALLKGLTEVDPISTFASQLRELLLGRQC